MISIMPLNSPCAQEEKTIPFQVSGAIIKFIYTGMLISLSPAQVRSFWKQHPLPYLSHNSKETELYHALWTANQDVPLAYMFSVMNALEQFLEGQGVQIETFVNATLRSISNGLILPPPLFLQWGTPFLNLFFQKKDIRLLILRLAPFFTGKIAPEIAHRIISHESKGNLNRTILMFMLSRKSGGNRAGRSIFSHVCNSFNCEAWTAGVMQGIPASLNLPAFENRFMLADCNTVADMLPDQEVEVKDSLLLINGRRYGTVLSFHDFLERQNLSLSKYGIPDRAVAVMTRDYACDRRKRVVLHKGCAYAAPVYIYGFRYRNDVPKPKDFFSSFISEAVTRNNEPWTQLRKLHAALLDQVSLKASFRFNTKDESIAINGVHIAKNAPAKILKKIVKTFLADDRTVFAHR